MRHPAYNNNPAIATANGRFRIGSNGSDVVYFDKTATSGADYKVRAKLTTLNLTGGDIAGPIIRCSATVDSFYTFVWIDYNGLTAGLAFFKHVNGNASQVGSSVTSLNGASVLPTSGSSAVLEIAVSGSTLTGSFNGAVALTLTDPDVTNEGYGGLYLHAASNDDGSGIQVDEFYVNDPAGSGTGGSGTGTGSNPTPPASLVISVTSAGHWCSPLNWDDDGTGSKPSSGVRAGAASIWSACNGAEGRFSWTTATASPNLATLGIDTSFLIGGSVPAGSFPKIKYRINDGAYHVAQVQPGSGGAWGLDVSGAGVSGPGTYTLRYYLMATSQGQPRWTPAANTVVPPNSLKVTGLTVDPGAIPVAPAVLGRVLAIFGDSITEGVEATGTNNGDLASNDSTLTYGRALASSLGAELGAIGFGAQGWEMTGGGGVVPFSTAFSFYSAGRPRDFSPRVDYVVCTHGTNDGLNNVADSAVTVDSAAWLTAARAKFGPHTRIFLCVPFGGFKRAALTAGFQQYQAATPDTSSFLIDGGTALQAGLTSFVNGGTWAAPGDGIHPDPAAHARIASTLNQAIEVSLDGAPLPPVVNSPIGSLQPSGASFNQFRQAGLSGLMDALIVANPALDVDVILGMRSGRNGSLDKTYQGLASLVEAFLRGDPIVTSDINNRLAEYAAVFAGYAQAAAEIAGLALDNPGTLSTLPPTPYHNLAPITQRTFG